MEVTQQQVEKFLKKVMDIQEEYAHEQRNAKASRQAKMRDWLNEHAAKELKNAD